VELTESYTATELCSVQARIVILCFETSFDFYLLFFWHFIKIAGTESLNKAGWGDL
jgi:hypothetical protein